MNTNENNNGFFLSSNLTALEEAQCLYSDLHKDARGFRPRDYSHRSLEELEARIADLSSEAEEAVEAAREEAALEAKDAFTPFREAFGL